MWVKSTNSGRTKILPRRFESRILNETFGNCYWFLKFQLISATWFQLFDGSKNDQYIGKGFK